MQGARSRRIGLAAVAAAAAAVGVVLAAQTAGASSGPRQPLQVVRTSLAQDGQQLVWQVQLADPFSPGALARDRRSLCLLIERTDTGRVAGQACVTGPRRRSREPRLTYLPVTSDGSGTARVIDATVTRSGSHELTARFPPAAVGVGYRPLRWQVISTLGGVACAPSTPQAPSCYSLFPATPTLLKLHTPQVIGCVPSGPSWVFHGPTNVREIALTFDDGPWNDTPKFLDVLEREHVPATFFEIGDQISTYGQAGAIERRMLADGDTIGDHTWNYGGDIVAGGSGATTQIEQAATAIRSATGGFEPCLFRAPGGNVTPALLSKARSLGFTTIQWDVDTRDWARPGTQAIYQNVITHAHNGAIVIQHDGGGDRSETLAALPQEIATLRREGYRFVTVTQMLGYRLLYR
jgi:peptidoglycan/xylan/chitin deacetylase (PgdA/CDA1 family)